MLSVKQQASLLSRMAPELVAFVKSATATVKPGGMTTVTKVAIGAGAVAVAAAILFAVK